MYSKKTSAIPRSQKGKKMKNTIEIYEDNAGGLYIFVAKNGKYIYKHAYDHDRFGVLCDVLCAKKELEAYGDLLDWCGNEPDLDTTSIIESDYCDLICDADMFYFSGGAAANNAFGLTDDQIDHGQDINLEILFTDDIKNKLAAEYCY